MQNGEAYINEGRGWSLYPFGKEAVAHFSNGISGWIIDIHLVSIEPGAVRGNHYHMNKEEYITIFGGKAILSICEAEHPGSPMKIEIDGKVPFQKRIDQFVVHAIKNTGNFPIYLFCYSKLIKPDEKASTVYRKIL
jgi:dTDP-4-dehydrorhamnose 3,5-epimerase-like enzyme